MMKEFARALRGFSPRNFTAVLVAAAMVAGCAGERASPPIPEANLSPADPILSTDQVADARTAIHLAVAHCFAKMPVSLFKAELVRDRWYVWADFKSSALSAEVAKSDGAVANCLDIGFEQRSN